MLHHITNKATYFTSWHSPWRKFISCRKTPLEQTLKRGANSLKAQRILEDCM